MLVSVIIPVYNVEKYLDKCVESVLNQTYNNLEIILVDDGSTDNCPGKCDEWANKDKRIKVIHKQNGGASDAKNVGLDNMTGEILMFLDADDYLTLDTIEILLNLMIKHNADVSCGTYIKVDENYSPLSKSNDKELICVYENDNKFDFLIEHGIECVVAWGKLYRKNVFNKLKYPFGKINEDEFVVHQYIERAEKIVYINKPIYFYLQRKTSTMGNGFSKKSLEAFEALKERIDFFKSKNVSLKYLKFAYGSYLRDIVNFYFKSENNSEINKLVLEEFENFKKLHRESGIKLFLKDEIKFFLFKHCKFLLKKLLKKL